jgi:hypothetical protein
MITQTETHHAVARLLSAAGSAHGVYEETELNGVYDQNWPIWYATYLLQHGLGDLLGAAIGAEELGGLLKQYDQDYQRERPAMGWPDFYAQQLLARAAA